MHQNTLHTFHSTLPSVGLGFTDGSGEQSGVRECMLLTPGWFFGQMLNQNVGQSPRSSFVTSRAGLRPTILNTLHLCSCPGASVPGLKPDVTPPVLGPLRCSHTLKAPLTPEARWAGTKPPRHPSLADPLRQPGHPWLCSGSFPVGQRGRCSCCGAFLQCKSTPGYL